MRAKKELGQHWLFDEASLEAVVAAGEVKSGDNVLEIGPGLGTLTDVLLNKGANVLAVEFDEELADELSDKALNVANLSVLNQDILQFDTSTISDYKVVANIPYYLTGKIIRKFLENENPPSLCALLVQKEVAERIAENPGNLSVIAVIAQHYCTVELGQIVQASLFTPPPKVDSQILILKRKQNIESIDEKKFFRLVKAGFGEKRKKLVNSLAGGLNIDKEQATKYVRQISNDENIRAQQLSLDDWYKLHELIND